MRYSKDDKNTDKKLEMQRKARDNMEMEARKNPEYYRKKCSHLNQPL